MLPMFSILLISAIGSIFICIKATHEMTRMLAGGSAIFCGIWGFALAPWPVQLLTLILVLQLERFYPFRKTGEVPVAIIPSKRR
jgi:hypothetical protein